MPLSACPETHAATGMKPPLVHACRVRGNGEVIKREEFELRKEAAEQARQARLNKKPKRLASQGKNVEEYPLLQVSTLHGNVCRQCR